MGISKTPHRGIYPYMSKKDDEQEFFNPSRYQPISTPTSMRSGALFGVPLKSSFTQQEVDDAMIQTYIDQAISELEHSLDIYITPICFRDRYDYASHGFSWNYSYIKLRHPNVNHVTKIQLSFSNEDEQEGLVDFPLEFVHLMPQEGVVQLVPAFGTSFSGFLLSAYSGTQFHALQHAGITGFPGGVRIEYQCGFEDGKVPALLNGLIEVMAAYRLLSILGPILFPHNSVGISIDGVSQSTSTPGPAFLNQRLTELEKIKNDMMDAAKGYYQRKFLIDQI